MKTVVRTKLLDEKHVELRSYELGVPLRVIHCLSDDYKKCTHLGEDYTTYSLSDQKKGTVINTQTSQFYPYKTYLMYKFLFKPKAKIEQTVIADKEITFDYKTNTAYLK